LHGDPDQLQALSARAAGRFRPGRLVFAVPPDSEMTLPEAPAGGVVARRCRGTVCDAPVTNPDAIGALLDD
jgi:hypothetical protein